MDIIAWITAFGVGAILTSLITLIKERKKDKAAVELSDIQTLQQKLAYVEHVYEFQKKHNITLQEDLDTAVEKARALRKRVSELEEELDAIKRKAAETQAQCEELSIKLRDIIDERNPHE